MSNPSRLEALKAMAEKRPDDPMIHYGLGSELRKLGNLPDAALSFRRVVTLNPSYTAAWQELGSILVEAGDREAAILALREGIAVADRTGAWKPREHMTRLLGDLEAAPTDACEPQPDGFCE